MNALEELFRLHEVGARATAVEVIFTVLICFALQLLITYSYIRTHRGRFYSQSFVHTLVIVGVTISVIIIVIGSNIARAFSLAGALSIIRFRSAIRDPRDVAYVFFSMGVGLACGAGLFTAAIILSVLLSLIVVLLETTDYGRNEDKLKLLKITLPENLNYEGLYDDVLNKYTDQHSFLSVRTVSLGTMFEVVYSVRVKRGISEKEMIDEIRERNGNLNVALLLDEQSYD
ncbi:DUF4956 domain-containing protein [Anoxynatronum buryatiense]|uniref:DUF4956 domain-containing protein n=1 Tax=Anoxynatronum buryatiense TaxID=489973 RepID=A0AA46AJ76_9CLOT|nr:DUF4956 domain-containing protein [Anoxynatronum buryatiense]SMP57327.1 protein of unknown function [Anoxynatronum buryatiense]